MERLRPTSATNPAHVWTDARGDTRPIPQHPDGGGESGRGLLLVEALTGDWGVRPHHPGSKKVWAVCRR
ncbi:ATP-binding protein [Streptomyces sp. NPDC056039]|uniref:ATP-binding protein n=1 Tax=Streptomyces sp. NPDC056039 TaxID=3345687 RepID=UPI0035DEAFF6